MATHRRKPIVFAAILGIYVSHPAAAQRTASVGSALPFDSGTVRSLLVDAFTFALKAPREQRTALLTAVGRMQVRVRDFAGAERTLAGMVEEAPLGAVTRASGQSPLFAAFERPSLITRVVCGLRDAGRSDNALAFVRRLPLGRDREWALAHIASLQARSPLTPADTVARRLGNTPEQWKGALALAREVKLLDARLDALIAVAYQTNDSTTSRDVARAAYDDARRIRLTDRDRQSSRTAMLARLALNLGRVDDVPSLLAALTNGQDLLDVTRTVAATPAAGGLLREFAPRAIAAGLAIRDSAARFTFLSPLRAALVAGVGDAEAERMLPMRLVGISTATHFGADRDSLIAKSTNPRDAATWASEHGDYAAVRREVARLPIADSAAKRARLWSDLAWGVYMTDRDTARTYLDLAIDALVHARVDSATFDDVADGIADRQFWIADHEGGIATLNLIRNPGIGESVVHEWGTSTSSGLNADRLRSYADRIRDPHVRDAVLLRVIVGYLAIRSASSNDLSRASGLADSIATPAIAVRARLAVANQWVQRGDSVQARRELTALLAHPGFRDEDGGRSVIGPLVDAGGVSEAVRWAHTGPSASRARRLMAVAETLHAQLERRSGRRWFNFSNGPDACLDVF